jgi:NTE family protein
MPDAPVSLIPTDDPAAPPTDAIGLCLSGGGYRAMVFHVGALWRLLETGMLQRLSRISSVSGGSIAAATLALAWPDLAGAEGRDAFLTKVVEPLRGLAGETIDADAIILGIALPGRISDRIAAAYKSCLFGDATLQALPDAPRFVINATNVQSGALWRFSKPYMADWRVGMVERAKIPLAQAVAASSAFPPMLSPVEMRLDPKDFTPGSGQDLQRPPFTSRVILSDGGVYDNLGLETVWKRCRTVLVSDGGGKMQPEEEPKSDWARHAYRVLDIVDNQVRALRKRQLIDSYQAPAADRNHRLGAYWGIRTDIRNYRLSDAIPADLARTTALAEVPTRLKRLDDETQERLINWGYAVCDAALRRHVEPGLTPSPELPYPTRGI